MISAPLTIQQPATQLPRSVVVVVLTLCIGPTLFHLLGVSFATDITPFPWDTAADLLPANQESALYHSLRGGFTHTLLEWTAFSIAMLTAALSLAHYSIERNVIVPILGMALFCAGLMDAYHTLAADQLLAVASNSPNLVPFTWGICRLFNALILIVGVSIFLGTESQHRTLGPRFIVLTSLTFIIAAYGIIDFCASGNRLPQTVYPHSVFNRPFDLVPLILYIVAAVEIFTPFYRRERGIFTHALLVSLAPHIATQLHMVFGSAAVHDSHYNVAHFLKIIAYLVPFVGLLLDYLRTYQEKQMAFDRLQHAQEMLKSHAHTLALNNRDLETLLYVTAHDLREPLRTIKNFSQMVQQKQANRLNQDGQDFLSRIVGASSHMHQLLDDILMLSRARQFKSPDGQVPGIDIVRSAIDRLQESIRTTNARIQIDDHFPTYSVNHTWATQAVYNLISNALKFVQPGTPPDIEIGPYFTDGDATDEIGIIVRDRGIGVATEHSLRIFHLFQRAVSREIKGTGAGLAIVRMIAERHGGQAWVQPREGGGAEFIITFRRQVGERAQDAK